MEKMNGAAQLVRALEELGVTEIFGYPGATVVDIYDELLNSKKIHHTLARHEQGAVHEADGYARASGKTGVALVTSGPGATNTVTAIATAYMDSVPLVVISGQVSTNLIGTDAFQEVDTVGVTRPVVKYSFLCKRPEDVAVNIRKAFYIASTGRKGPVLVDIPKNCQSKRYVFDYEPNSEVRLRSYNPTFFGHKGQVRRAAELLNRAKRPVMLLGGGVVQGEASQEACALARRMNLPVVTTLMGIGAFPETDAQSLGMLGMHGLFEANEAMNGADLIFAAGTRFADRSTNNVRKFCPDATVVHIDVDPASISKTVHADVPIVGDVKTVLNQISAVLDEMDLRPNEELQPWWSQIDKWRGRHCLSYQRKPDMIRPQTVIETVYRLSKEREPIVTTDVGQHQMFTAQYFKFDKPRRLITSGGLGTMGFGVPAAVGVQKALPDRTVITFTGDGSFQMCFQELALAAKYRMPLKIFILDNSVLGMVRQFQTVFYHHRYAGTNLDFNPDFLKIAEAYGALGIRVKREDELEDAIKRALDEKDRPAIVDVITDTNAIVLPWQRADGSMVEMILDEEK
ncbi:MAG: biosynthetic-type acetolactate synthase large subunit [Succinatimonas sp.]|nr:biosynthetic-type acetolactate synthase large subunit [Succinatimonas sp.]